MKWLDAWKVRSRLKTVGKVSPSLEQELVAGINLFGYLRKMVREELVNPACTAITEAWKREVTGAEQSVLEREAELAVLACATLNDSGPQIEGQAVSPRSIVVIALKMIEIDAQAAEAAGKVGRAISTDYSNVPEEALSQLIVAWGASLQIDSPDFRSVVVRSKTLRNWGAFGEFVDGALTGMGRTSYPAMREKAVESIVEMQLFHRQLVLQAFERISAGKRVVDLSPATKVRQVDGPAIGSPEWKKANAIFFLPPTELLKVEQEIEMRVLKWIEEHPLNRLPWEQVLGQNFDKLAGLVGSAFLVEVVLLSYAAVLGAAASREPKFFNSRVHKELESEFVKQNAAALQAGGTNRQLFEAPPQGQAEQLFPTDGAAGLETLQRIRTAVWHYADPKRPAASEPERLARILGSTPLMRLMAVNPECQSFVFGLSSMMVESASASIANLIRAYQESPLSD